MRVLVVEDEPAMANVLRRWLSEEGFAVDIAVDVEEGWWHISEQPYDAVVLDAGAAGDPAHHPPGAVPVHPLPVGSQEDRAVEALADGQVDSSRGAWRELDGDDLAALAQHGEGAVTAFEAERVHVGDERLGDQQPVDREQGDQRVFVGCTKPSRVSASAVSGAVGGLGQLE